MSTLRETLLAKAREPGGINTQALANAGVAHANSISHMCSKLARQGLLHRAKISHRVVRWCATPEQAKALVDLAYKTQGDARERASAVKMPAALKLDSSLPVVNPNNVKPTVLPCGYTPKYEGLVGSVTFGLQRGRVTR